MLTVTDARVIVESTQSQRDDAAKLINRLRREGVDREKLLEITADFQERFPGVTPTAIRRRIKRTEQYLHHVSTRLQVAVPEVACPRYIGEDDRINDELRALRVLLEVAA